MGGFGDGLGGCGGRDGEYGRGCKVRRGGGVLGGDGADGPWQRIQRALPEMVSAVAAVAVPDPI